MKDRDNYIDNIIKGLSISMLATTCIFIFDIKNENYIKSITKTEMVIDTLKYIKNTEISYKDCKILITQIILDLKFGIKNN